MSILDRLASIIAPHDCVRCGTEGSLLCQSCSTKLIAVTSRCYRCRKLTEQSRTCHACRKTSKLYRLRVTAVYDGAAKSLIAMLKFNGAQAAASEMAHLMRFNTELNQPIIVPVPTATSRVRQRGYDQAKLLARCLARQHKLVYTDCLARSGQAHQVGARRQQRLQQLSTAYRVKAAQSVIGMHIILVDDVVTTGATLEAAATCLRKAGAKHVEAIVFAQA